MNLNIFPTNKKKAEVLTCRI
uniref:Uncharacterized protein n=1 Tax=Anguilla anguilla TaxID=7936 RepID=A0A0E9U3N8_ANGAN